MGSAPTARRAVRWSLYFPRRARTIASAAPAQTGRDGAPSRLPYGRYALVRTRTRRSSMAVTIPHHAGPPAPAGPDRARGEAAQRPHREVGGDVPPRRQGAERGRRVVVPAARPVADLPRARRRTQGVGRRRQRDVGLPQRLRRDGPGPRAPGDRRGAPGALPARHPLRRPDRGRDRRGRGARPALGPAEVALHELRLRVDDGRDPDRAGLHRPRDDHEDLRLLPRPPRRGDGLDRRRVRQDRRPGQPRLARIRRRHPAGRRRPDDRRAVQRRRRDGAPDRAAGGRGPQARLRDHGGGDDEPRDRAPRARIPRGRARDHRSATGSS